MQHDNTTFSTFFPQRINVRYGSEECNKNSAAGDRVLEWFCKIHRNRRGRVKTAALQTSSTQQQALWFCLFFFFLKATQEILWAVGISELEDGLSEQYVCVIEAGERKE